MSHFQWTRRCSWQSISSDKRFRDFKTTGKGGVVLVSWTPSLTEQAHLGLRSLKVNNWGILSEKIFFLPHERYLANDKLLSNLRFGEDLGFIPVYDALPDSESVAVIHSAKVSLPVLAEHQIEAAAEANKKSEACVVGVIIGG